MLTKIHPFDVDLDLYSQTKRTVLKKQKRNITEHSYCTFQTDDRRICGLLCD